VTESRWPKDIPVGHIISRVFLASLVVSLVVTAVVLVVLNGADELAIGRIVWGSVRNWALPW
jgi:hypothetical protein